MTVRRVALSLAVLLLASASTPYTFRIGEVLEQPRHESANGRYVAVERWFEAVGDFEKRRVDSVYIDRHGNMPPYSSSRVVLYEKPRRRIAKVRIDPGHRDIRRPLHRHGRPPRPHRRTADHLPHRQQRRPAAHPA